MLNKWIAPLIVVAVLVLASCNDMDGDGEDDPPTANGTPPAMGPNDQTTKSSPDAEPRPTDRLTVTPEPPSFTGLVGSWRFIDESFDPELEPSGGYKPDLPVNEPTHDTLTFDSTLNFMRVEKQYAYDGDAVVPHPYYPDPEDDTIPETVTGAWLELPDPFPFTLDGATYKVARTKADPPVSQVTITRVTTEGTAKVTCDFEIVIVTTHHTGPIRYLTLANCKGERASASETGVDAFKLLAWGVPLEASSRDVKLSSLEDGVSAYDPDAYSYRFVDTSE